MVHLHDVLAVSVISALSAFAMRETHTREKTLDEVDRDVHSGVRPQERSA